MTTTAADPTTPELLRLVGDPLRWRLLALLRDGDLRVGELVSAIGRPQNVVSYHLGELRSAGLVSGRRSSADRRDTYYRVHLDRLGDLLGAAAHDVDPTLRTTRDHPGPVPGAAGRRRRVLFLCTGNSARSQIAEALCVHHSGGTVDARSAGSHPKALHPDAVRVLAERGIDISGARTTRVDAVRHVRFDRVVTLCDKVREVCPELPGAPPATHWSLADPSTSAEGDDATYPAFLAATEDIDGRVRRLLADLAPLEATRAR